MLLAIHTDDHEQVFMTGSAVTRQTVKDPAHGWRGTCLTTVDNAHEE